MDNFKDNEILLAEFHKTKDIRLRNKIIENNLRLVYDVAFKLSKICTVPVDDLVQIGSIGLITAVERYDPSRSVKFCSFAMPTIKGSILMYLRDKSKVVRVPRKLQTIYQKIKNHAIKKGVSYETAAKELECDLFLAQKAEIACTDVYQELPELAVNGLKENEQELQILLDKLPIQHRIVIEHIHLQGYNFNETKNILGISLKELKALEAEAFAKLKLLAQQKLFCNKCNSTDIVKNGLKRKKQNYLCKNCGAQFLHNAAPVGRASFRDYLKVSVLTALSEGKSYRWCEKHFNISKSIACKWSHTLEIVDDEIRKKPIN